MLKKTIALIGLTLSLGANATIIDFGNITRDTSTGLDWLDVTLTRGLSYNQVTAQLVVGGAYMGYRYATTTELDQLITNFGIGTTNSSCDYGVTHCGSNTFPDSEQTEMFIRLLGDTGDAYYDSVPLNLDAGPDGAFAVLGFLGDNPFGVPNAFVGMGEVLDGEVFSRFLGGPVGDTLDFATVIRSPYLPDDTYGDVGSFLVKPVLIPVPATLSLLGIALAGLGWSRRKKA